MEETTIRECTTIEEFDRCVELQREAFGLPDLELSPRRHLIVSRQAGGWTLGAFVADRMVGFVHHLAGVRGDNEIFGYSHVMAVAKDYQNKGVGARLKWAQRERALRDARKLIKWTWDPMMARNAHFNLNRLGATVETYFANFYGVDYGSDRPQDERPGLPSDRLSATWNIASARVHALAKGLKAPFEGKRVGAIVIPTDFNELRSRDVQRARDEQTRVREQFQRAFAEGFICAGFERGPKESSYVLFEGNSNHG